MGKRFVISESEMSEIRRLYNISEQNDMSGSFERESEPQQEHPGHLGRISSCLSGDRGEVREFRLLQPKKPRY